MPRPNKSFKPTTHRGINSVLCATLHAVAAPLRGGLTPALGGNKHYFQLLWLTSSAAPLIATPLPFFNRYAHCVRLSGNASESLRDALTHRIRCVRRLRKQ